ncbi:hypothetical protein [Comamonas sp. B21-038]|uniref:hypothetical protein n=1 Tax=Comamonas sp. B21-038 TaxID=2918299 RepID=UPI001EFB0D68|nr:hypothetical protein [Comamonas sp. B21-038]ULR88360.1 hypothetical protein MJ205_18250 [Comamonas sp. B21-038]
MVFISFLLMIYVSSMLSKCEGLQAVTNREKIKAIRRMRKEDRGWMQKIVFWDNVMLLSGLLMVIAYIFSFLI